MPSKQFSLSLHVDSLPPEGSSGNRDDYIQNLPLYKAVDIGNLEATKNFLNRNPCAAIASLSADGNTALHVAVLSGHIKIVEELVNRIPKENLVLKNHNGSTSLIYAATGGDTKIADLLVRKCPELLKIPNHYGNIPVVVASLNGHRDLVRYLYFETPEEELDPQKGKNGAMLITTCIINELYDIALDLLQHYPELATAQDSDNDTALDILTQKPSAFPSGSQLAFWQKCIYSCILIHLPFSNGNGKRDIEGLSERKHATKPIPHIMEIYNLKLAHSQVQELLHYLCAEISTMGEQKFEEVGTKKAIFKAVENGIVEILMAFIEHYPDIVWFYDQHNRNIFMVATLQRQEKVFNLISKMGAKKNAMATSWDRGNNNLLHQAAFLAPSTQLDRVSGAALQMQRELQWYKEVEKLVQPKYNEMVNRKSKTPRALFTEQHKQLMEQGEKWLKDTAESCTVVAALIVTIMFSAAFTVPGDLNQQGIPLFLHRNSFLVYIISDAMSLLSSSTSLLMFLGILTSRYSEEDFYKSLPTKLIIGLSTLFFSIATMMVTFGVAIVVMLHERVSWVSFPIVFFGSLPVTLFAFLQFPLLVQIFLSTHGPGIFERAKIG
ncbi:hypothetical protein ACFE04_017518 [Oxalis oulophora]